MDGFDLENMVKKRCIEGILLNISFLNKYGLLDEKVERREKCFSRLSKMKGTTNPTLREYLPDFAYTKEEMLDLFTRERLEKCSLMQLLALNAEWSNIATKSINDVNKMLFLIKQLGLIDDIRQGENLSLQYNTTDKINNESLKATFEKVYILKGLINKMLSHMYSMEVDEVNTRESATRMTRSYANQYKEYFSNFLSNSSNDVLEDFEYYKTGENIRCNLYKQKDDNMLALVSIFQNEKEKLNWGIIIDNDNVDDDDFIPLGFDVPGLTMAIRLHIPKNILEDHMRNILETNIIRVYEGARDFETAQFPITANGVFLANDKYKKALKNIVANINEEDQLYNYIMHQNYIINQNVYPKSMKVAQKTKNKIKYSRKMRVFYFDDSEVMSQREYETKLKQLNKNKQDDEAPEV